MAKALQSKPGHYKRSAFCNGPVSLLTSNLYINNLMCNQNSANVVAAASARTGQLSIAGVPGERIKS